MSKFIQWWLTPKFPRKHIENILSYRTSGFAAVRNFYRTWLVHPIKRRVAKFYLILLKRIFGLKVVGITGSAGKTTTKEMLASILSLSGKTVYSYANIDPVYNIPATILKCTPSTKYLVLEMGIEYPGEMDFYLYLAKPDVGVLTNVNATHTEFLGSIEGVAREKAKLLVSVPDYGTSVINNEDKYIKSVSKNLKSKKLSFGTRGDVYATGISSEKGGVTKFTLNYNSNTETVQVPFLGKHFVQNALAAACAGIALNIPLIKIAEGLKNMEVPEHRMNFIYSKKGYLIIDDTYNANPLAVSETLETFSEMKVGGRRIFVFGEMKELGDLAIKSHREIGNAVARARVDVIFSVGVLTKHTLEAATEKGLSNSNAFYFENNRDLISSLKKYIRSGDTVLIKGSRSMKLEEVVGAIK